MIEIATPSYGRLAMTEQPASTCRGRIYPTRFITGSMNRTPTSVIPVKTGIQSGKLNLISRIK